jgi:hypothetical protein
MSTVFTIYRRANDRKEWWSVSGHRWDVEDAIRDARASHASAVERGVGDLWGVVVVAQEWRCSGMGRRRQTLDGLKVIWTNEPKPATK